MITEAQALALKPGDKIRVDVSVLYEEFQSYIKENEPERYIDDTISFNILGVTKYFSNGSFRIFVSMPKNMGAPINFYKIQNSYNQIVKDALLAEKDKGNDCFYFFITGDENELEHIYIDNSQHLQQNDEKFIIQDQSDYGKLKRFFFSDLEEEYIPPKNSPFKFI